MPFLIAFVGWHNSGKTTIATRVAGQLRTWGHTVGVLKSTKETGLAPEHQGSDSDRYLQMGVERVALLAPDAIIIRDNETRPDVATLARRLFPDMDFVLIEGCKRAKGLAKIEVRREDLEDPPIAGTETGSEVIALVCDSPVDDALPRFHSTDSIGIARHILSLRDQHQARP